MVKRVKTGTLFSIVASLWIGVTGAALRGCGKDTERIRSDQCVTRIQEQYKEKAREYCNDPCIRNYVSVAGHDHFRGRQIHLSEVVDECEDRKKNPGKYDGQVLPATRHIFNRDLDQAYKRGQ